MPTIEVFSRRNASNALPVMWTLGELGLAYVRHDIGGSFGGTKASEYLAMNPNGRIPTIKDGEFVLWESNAIVRYLCRRYDKASLLLPTNEMSHALAAGLVRHQRIGRWQGRVVGVIA